jgi:hypothetical protein
MERRGVLVRRELATWLRARLPELTASMPESAHDLEIEGRDATGLKSRVPWVRIYSLSRSPSATRGWYAVYLFGAAGDRAYLTLMPGTTRWENGEFRPRTEAEIQALVDWSRKVLANDLDGRPDLVWRIDLGAPGAKLARQYELGCVAAIAYDAGAIPSDERLLEDLRGMVALLGRLYRADDEALSMPGEPAPEIADVLTATGRLAGRPARGQGFRLSVADRLAIERHAMDVACRYLLSLGWAVEDVGAFSPYDIDATRGDQQMFVEVKGTTSDGTEVLLTHGEVELHRREHPRTMLLVVHSIALAKGDPPIASGGSLRVIDGFWPDAADLTPIAYRYKTPRVRREGA